MLCEKFYAYDDAIVTLVMSCVVWLKVTCFRFMGPWTCRQQRTDCGVYHLGVLPLYASFRAVAMSCVHAEPGKKDICVCYDFICHCLALYDCNYEWN